MRARAGQIWLWKTKNGPAEPTLILSVGKVCWGTDQIRDAWRCLCLLSGDVFTSYSLATSPNWERLL